MTAQDLKNSVLQLAIQGKLVEQRAEEGTARELIEQIELEKERLIKEKKLREEKHLPKIAEEEIPFEIPESWEWVRLSGVVDVRDGTHDSPRYYETGIPLITSKNISNGGLSFDNVKYISKEDAKKINERSNVDTGDILFAMIGSIGNPVIVNKDRDFCVKNVALFKVFSKEKLYVKYLYWFLFFEQFVIKRIASGGVQLFVSLKVFRNYLFPLPPYEEQKRIVKKVEDLLTYIEKYDKAYSKLEVLDKKFQEDIQKSILQYAMQGKLVVQRPEEGTGEELYWQIQAEKEKLIKAGKIKKEKSLQEISEGEIPFDIPDSWKWARVGNIFTVIRGSSPRPKGSPLYWTKKKTDYNWITIKDISAFCKDGILSQTTEFLTRAGADLSTYVGKDELIIAVSGSTTGKHCVLGIDGYIYDGLAAILNPTKIINSSYLLLFFDWVYDRLNAQKVGSAFPNINTDILKNTLIPLPPLGEQERIVMAMKNIIPCCKRLSKD